MCERCRRRVEPGPGGPKGYRALVRQMQEMKRVKVTIELDGKRETWSVCLLCGAELKHWLFGGNGELKEAGG